MPYRSMDDEEWTPGPDNDWRYEWEGEGSQVRTLTVALNPFRGDGYTISARRPGDQRPRSPPSRRRPQRTRGWSLQLHTM